MNSLGQSRFYRGTNFPITSPQKVLFWVMKIRGTNLVWIIDDYYRVITKKGYLTLSSGELGELLLLVIFVTFYIYLYPESLKFLSENSPVIFLTFPNHM